MRDARVDQLAAILVRYSVAARRGEQIGISATTAAEPLVAAIYEELLRVGAYPVLRLQPPSCQESFFRLGQPHHFSETGSIARLLARELDGQISIYSDTNTRALSAIDPARQTQFMKTMRPIKDRMLHKKWNVTLFPTEAFAQDAAMSLKDFEDYVYGAVFADEPNPIAAWKQLLARQQKMIGRLKGADRVHIEGPGTDLTFSVKGRHFINSGGTNNMPSGEIFTGPLESSVAGHIRFDFPVCVHGREIDGIRLVFRGGRVVEATATRNNDFLQVMLATDPGARRLGEFGIGTNPRINRFIRNILFDEKIGGTIHLALGMAYAETGGRNKSAIHWDLIKDLRQDGRVRIDGKPFLVNGRFV